jgi:hypothetical protein
MEKIRIWDGKNSDPGEPTRIRNTARKGNVTVSVYFKKQKPVTLLPPLSTSLESGEP